MGCGQYEHEVGRLLFFEKPSIKFERLILMLLVLDGLIIFAQSSAIAPSIYTLF